MVLLIRFNYAQESVEVLLNPKLLKSFLVVVVTGKHVSLRHELLSCILGKYRSEPIEHKSCTVHLLDFVRVEWVYTVHAYQYNLAGYIYCVVAALHEACVYIIRYYRVLQENLISRNLFKEDTP